MKHDYLDKYSGGDSLIHRRDARVKLVCFLMAVIAVVSEPRGDMSAFPFYYVLIIGLTLAGRIPFVYVFKRCLIASPFIIMAAGVLPLSYVLSQETAPLSRELWLYHPLSILLKAYAAIILLTLLTSTEKFHRLLKGLRTLKFPPVLGIMSALMYRYIFILNDERLRTNRARVCRLAGKPRTSSFRIYGNQAALIFLRGKKRAQDIYNAMLARGFTGEFPEYDAFRLHTADWIFLGVVVISFTGVRFGL